MPEKYTSRRAFLKTAGTAGIVAGLSAGVLPSWAREATTATGPAASISYSQQPLLYAYSDLEAAIDAQTMEIHYTKHAATYTKNLADACVAEKIDTASLPLEDLLAKISGYSAKVRNNGGGHYNHELFWKSMSPKATGKPTGTLLAALEKDFGSFETFKTQFADAGKNRFGSGWAWLVVTPEKKLAIGSTPNQDNPLMDVSPFKGIPLLGLDVWEHAYYLRYQNKRPDYIDKWWSVVNWDFVEKRFTSLG